MSAKRSYCTAACSRCTAELVVYAIAGCCNRHWPDPNSNMPMPRASDIIDMATACTAGIVRNHPFLDKRTGFVVGILFLELNGYRFVASEEDAAQAVLKLADGTLDEADHSSCLRGNLVRKK